GGRRSAAAVSGESCEVHTGLARNRNLNRDNGQARGLTQKLTYLQGLLRISCSSIVRAVSRRASAALRAPAESLGAPRRSGATRARISARRALTLAATLEVATRRVESSSIRRPDPERELISSESSASRVLSTCAMRPESPVNDRSAPSPLVRPAREVRTCCSSESWALPSPANSPAREP